MICKKCGKKVIASHGKCPACGASMPKTQGGNGFFDILSPEVLDNAPVSAVPRQGAGGVSESAMRSEIAKRDAFWSSKLKAAKRLTAVFLVFCLIFAATTAVMTALYINKKPEKLLNELPDTVITQGSREDVSNEALEEDNVGKFKAEDDKTEYNMGDSSLTEIGDGIPDKYQKKLVFTIENGTFANGKTEWIFYVNLVDENDERSETGTTTLLAYEDRLPNINPNKGYVYEGSQIDINAPITAESNGVYELKCVEKGCQHLETKVDEGVKTYKGETWTRVDKIRCVNCGAELDTRTESGNCEHNSTKTETEDKKYNANGIDWTQKVKTICKTCGKVTKTETKTGKDKCQHCNSTAHTTENHPKCEACGSTEHTEHPKCPTCGSTEHTTHPVEKCDICQSEDHKTENCTNNDNGIIYEPIE